MVEGDFDLSAGYTFPWWGDGPWVVTELAPNFKLGGYMHTQFDLYMVKMHIWLNLAAMEL